MLQIADSNQGYLEAVAAEIAKKNADDDPWAQFFAIRFPEGSQARLYLIINGIDEAHAADQEAIVALIRLLPTANLRIQVIFTSRPSIAPPFGDDAAIVIHLSKDRLKDAMKMLTAAGMQSLPRLRKFHRHTKRKIERLVVAKAENMLYVEHSLRRWNAIGRERAVLKDLDRSLPESLETLYDLLLAECQKGRSHAQYLTLKTLFAMLAYSERPLSLDEARELVGIVDRDGTFDIEDELIGGSARFLHLGRELEKFDDSDRVEHYDTTGSDDDDEEKQAGIEHERGKVRTSLQERALVSSGLPRCKQKHQLTPCRSFLVARLLFRRQRGWGRPPHFR